MVLFFIFGLYFMPKSSVENCWLWGHRDPSVLKQMTSNQAKWLILVCFTTNFAPKRYFFELWCPTVGVSLISRSLGLSHSSKGCYIQSWVECVGTLTLRHSVLLSSTELSVSDPLNSAELSRTECLSMSVPPHSTQDWVFVTKIVTFQND